MEQKSKYQRCLRQQKSIRVGHQRGAKSNAGYCKKQWGKVADQACFLTRKAWGRLSTTWIMRIDQKYFISFMGRLQEENDVIFTPRFTVNPREDSQIIFRNDSIERFDEHLRYDQRDKAALLVQLLVSGIWDRYGANESGDEPTRMCPRTLLDQK